MLYNKVALITVLQKENKYANLKLNVHIFNNFEGYIDYELIAHSIYQKSQTMLE